MTQPNTLSMPQSSVPQASIPTNSSPIMPSSLPSLNTMPSNNSVPTTSSSSSIFSSMTFKIVMIILILALLGFNIFRYVANSTDYITDNFSKDIISILSSIGIVAKDTTTTIADKTNQGVKTTSDLATGLVKKSLNPTSNDDTINKSKKKKKDPPKPAPPSKKSSKSGYCYIGEDRGFRSCIKVGDESMNDCLSEMIYPTKELCINPRLRE